MRGLREEGDELEQQRIVWVSTSSPWRLSEHEFSGPVLIEAVARERRSPPPLSSQRYALKQLAERVAREAEPSPDCQEAAKRQGSYRDGARLTRGALLCNRPAAKGRSAKEYF